MKHWQKNLRRAHRFTALLVLLYALVLYGATVSPSVALWDPGEFIASAHGLQVMHPPGAPFYILLGRLFSMFVPAAYVALAVNLVSVAAAAVTVLLAYLIIVAHFRFTHLDDPDVYYADDARAMAGFHYRLTYTDAADTLIEGGQREEARRLMDTLMDEVPPDTIPIHPSQALSLARTYLVLGEEARSAGIVREAEPRVLHQVRTAASQAGLEQAVRHAQALQYTYAQARAFDEAAGLSDQLAAALGDDRFRQTPDDFRRMYDEGLRP